MGDAAVRRAPLAWLSVPEEFKLGGLVLHRGKAYTLRGCGRKSESNREYVDLEDAETGARFSIPADEAYPVTMSHDDPPLRMPRKI